MKKLHRSNLPQLLCSILMPSFTTKLYPVKQTLFFPAAARKKKKGHGETVIPPRSLFEKASMLKVRREGKDQKKNFSLKQQAPFAKPLPSLVKPAMEAGQDNPEWLISEDWALLQVLATLPSFLRKCLVQAW